ncbi:MAG: carbohydrate binding domain-containing protein [Oscillospiraceae bacterium]|nr:carbohydrate binding domain-containing protein [Oscillospiraceae bacterium]
MKKLCALLASAVLAAAAIPRFGPEQAVSAAGTVKIMPVGDSITFGMGENGGYRKYLYDTLKKDGYDIDMVGPEGSNSASANGITYDDNHAGYSGYQIKEEPSWAQQQGTSGSLYNTLKQKNAVKQYQPDIILLIIGTNDMTANRSMDACASDLRAVVDYMLGDLPSGGVIFMGSIPEFTAYGGNAQRVANYNNTVKSVAEEYGKAGKNVKFADVHGCLNGTADLGNDQLHPNGGGYKKMGNFWAETVEDYLKNGSTTVTPGTTEPVTTTPPQTTTDPDGYIAHYTFENGDEDFTGRGGASVKTATEAYAGSKSLLCSGRTDGWNGAAHALPSGCSAGGTYSFSAAVKYTSGSASDTFHFTLQYSSGSTSYKKIATETVTKGDWVQLANANFEIPAGATDCTIYIETDSSTNDFYVDEIIIAKAGTTISGPKPAKYAVADVNGDGFTNAVDLSLAKAGMIKGSFSASGAKKGADVTQDGDVTKDDITWFVKYLTKQETTIPEPPPKPVGQMRSIEEYTPVAKEMLVEREKNGSTSRRNGVTYSEVKKYQYRSKKANKNKNVNVMLPPGYDESKQYPVLYVLHGFFENEDRMILTGNNPPIPTREIICNAWADGEAEDMIVVVPFVFTSATMNDATDFSDPGSNEGYDNFVDDIVDSLMPWVEENFSVATGRENTAVTGFSMGGRESLQIGMKYGDKFGYVGAICPAPGASGAWKWNSPDETPALVMITGGTNDNVVGLNTPQGYHNNFDKNNVPHLWHVVNGGNHGDDSICAHIYNFVRMVFKA